MKTKVVIIAGPTGSGKSPLALHLAGIIGGEIIVADSVHVYRYMDIGTAKPTPEERALIPHHLVDIIDPDETFSAGQFRTLAENAIIAIQNRKKQVVVCGGTGLYIKALIRGLFSASCGSEAMRQRLREEEVRYGEGYLYEQLKKVDPSSAARIHPHDLFRIVRGLEIYHLTGVSLYHHHEQHGFKTLDYKVLQIGIGMDRSVLYDRINARSERMMADGFLEEVNALVTRGYHAGLRSMQSLGYRHLCAHLAGQLTLREAVNTMKRDTRRFAKRQLTWFRADPGIVWIDEPFNKIRWVEELLRDFLSSS